MGISKATPNSAQHPGKRTNENGAKVSAELVEKARADTVLKELASRLDGLSQAEADSRLKQFGLNEIAREKRQSPLMRLVDNVKNLLSSAPTWRADPRQL